MGGYVGDLAYYMYLVDPEDVTDIISRTTMLRETGTRASRALAEREREMREGLNSTSGTSVISVSGAFHIGVWGHRFALSVCGLSEGIGTACGGRLACGGAVCCGIHLYTLNRQLVSTYAV